MSDLQKAHGVYYTPKPVVDYIVDHTIGNVLDTRELVDDAQGLRILDPACGRGAFLIGAYRRLLDWHRQQYLRHRRFDQTRLVQDTHGKWQLTIAERLRVLSSSVFGVDRDWQAVQIARLNLLVLALSTRLTTEDRVLADCRSSTDGEATLDGLTQLVAELQPTTCRTETTFPADQNLKCGDALRGPCFLDHDQIDASPPALRFGTENQSPDEQLDWAAAFPQINSEGGFDFVIGNPPYHRELNYKQLMQRIRNAPLGRKYHTPRMDLWYYFVHRGLELLKSGGQLAFITSAYWMAGAAAKKLIAAFHENAHIEEMFLLGDLKIFENVSGQHMILRLTNESRADPTRIKVVRTNSGTTADAVLSGKASVVEYLKNPGQLFRSGRIDCRPDSTHLLAKLERANSLGELGRIRQGIAENPAAINPRTNARFGQRWRVGQGVFVLHLDELEQLKLSKRAKTLLRPYHKLADLGRYSINANPKHCLIYSTKHTCPQIDDFPALREHLGKFQVIMEQRRETRSGSNAWWHLHWPRDESIWQSPKILALQMGPRPAFVPIDIPTYVSFSVNVFLPNDANWNNLYYLTAILNSRLIWKWFQHHAKSRGMGLEINGHVLARVPVPSPPIATVGRTRYDTQVAQIVKLVPRLLSLQRQPRPLDQTDRISTSAKRIARIDEQLDRLVYELFELNDHEIQQVEMSTEL